ncbi:Aste57867_2194 [Aphanomyces stellatus]|uniref:Aste57867_2194 protein n=1 Tax=Aphanomyces stellatus TaxID=120398 RepID=A0A485KBB3_9STRA|nr:hypothetical protein As57867_002189 [Aphanomyces stellatus]VFT79397.1 Aste57867_2194 [Aphanomyces stellatus]
MTAVGDWIVCGIVRMTLAFVLTNPKVPVVVLAAHLGHSTAVGTVVGKRIERHALATLVVVGVLALDDRAVGERTWHEMAAVAGVGKHVDEGGGEKEDSFHDDEGKQMEE